MNQAMRKRLQALEAEKQKFGWWDDPEQAHKFYANLEIIYGGGLEAVKPLEAWVAEDYEQFRQEILESLGDNTNE